jgi:hypothetical protein
MRVGEGNRLEGCYSHDNIDDGFDLFNKIEDGANGVVVIENSIARNNTSNGLSSAGKGSRLLMRYVTASPSGTISTVSPTTSIPASW